MICMKYLIYKIKYTFDSIIPLILIKKMMALGVFILMYVKIYTSLLHIIIKNETNLFV